MSAFVRRLCTSVATNEKQRRVFMDLVHASATLAAPRIVRGLQTRGFAVIDDFFSCSESAGAATIKELRDESVLCFDKSKFSVSQSTRWDDASQSTVYFDKKNVFSMQLNGGDDYEDAPRLHEYIVEMVRTLTPLLREAFPSAHLNSLMAGNKLAVCTGEGSSYDKHYDNSGAGDLRKITILMYMNANYTSDMGGQFRIFNTLDQQLEFGATTDLEPIANRLLCFWSDKLVHSVLPSFAQRGVEDHRYALTLWLSSTHEFAINKDDAEVKRHFG